MPNTIKLMLADRLSNPCSNHKTYLNSDYYDQTPKIDLHNIYKSLNELCSLKDGIEKHLFKQCMLQEYIDLDVVFFDVTTFHFESVKQDDIRDFGYSKACKFNEVQVVLSLFISKNGIPMGFDVFPGNTYEGNTLKKAISRLKNSYDINKIIVVADRGINSGSNLHLITQEKFDYIVGSKIKSLSKEMKKNILKSDDYIVTSVNDSGEILFKYKIIKYNKKVKIDQKITTIPSRIVCTWSKKRADKDLLDRERLINKAKKIVSNGDSTDTRGAKKYLTSYDDKKKVYTLNEDKILEDSKWDGFYGLETSDHNLSRDEILSAYNQLWKIEESFRVYKSHLETRPLYHWNPERIQGHFVLSYIAFLFERTLEIELKNIETNSVSPERIRDSLNKMEFSELQFGNNKHKIYSPLDSLGADILRVLNIKHPKKIKEKSAA